MAKFPFFPQHDLMDCGPSCLRMIAAYYGKQYTLEGLREKSHITREGVSLLGISEAAEQLGLRTMGVLITYEELRTVPLPCIIHWNQQHFVVVYKIKTTRNNDRIYVADPGAGKIAYNKEEFKRCWINTHDSGEEAGTALLLETTPEFFDTEEVKPKSRGFGFLLSYVRPYKKLIYQLLAGLTLGSLLQLIFPFLTQSIVDFGITTKNLSYIYLVLAAQLMLMLSSSAVEFIRGWILLHMGARINISLVAGFLSKLMKLPMSYFDTKMTGDILQRMGDHARIQDFLTNTSLHVIFGFFNILIFSVILLLYNFWVFLIFITGSVLYICWVSIFMKKRALLDHKSFAQLSANQSNVVQLISGMQEIKLNACEKQKRWEWESIQAKLFNLRIKGLALSQYQDSGAVIINQTKNILITALVAKFVIDGQMTLGMMLAVQYILGQLNGPVEQLIHFYREAQDAKLSLNRLSEVHDKEDEDPANKNLISEIPDNADLQLQDVVFTYDKTSEGKVVLKLVNIQIPAGKQTAIVGTSGSGKTTMMKLMLGFYPPVYGTVKLNDLPLHEYNMNAWRKQCGVVMQDGFIFSDTIAGNIAPGEENIDMDRFQMAIEIAHIKDFIENLPLKYNTRIGSDGSGLSQGQKQRILIARAVYKNPQFIFMDEATNALDTRNEKAILDSLNGFLKGKTSVIIAHRLSTVKQADQIIVIEDGSIVEQGTHETLSAAKGYYYRLVKNQLEL